MSAKVCLLIKRHAEGTSELEFHVRNKITQMGLMSLPVRLFSAVTQITVQAITQSNLAFNRPDTALLTI